MVGWGLILRITLWATMGHREGSTGLRVTRGSQAMAICPALTTQVDPAWVDL